MINLALIAAQIYVKLETDDEFASEVSASNEPFRAMVYESGLMGDIVDGSPEWEKLIDILDYLNAQS